MYAPKSYNWDSVQHNHPCGAFSNFLVEAKEEQCLHCMANEIKTSVPYNSTKDSPIFNMQESLIEKLSKIKIIFFGKLEKLHRVSSHFSY